MKRTIIVLVAAVSFALAGCTGNTTPAPTAPPSGEPTPVSEDADAALEAYRGYWKTLNAAMADPTKNWTADLDDYAAGDELAVAQHTLAALAGSGDRLEGEVVIDPKVDSDRGGRVQLTDCVDYGGAKLIDLATGQIATDDLDDGLTRHLATAVLQRGPDDTYYVVATTDERGISC